MSNSIGVFMAITKSRVITSALFEIHIGRRTSLSRQLNSILQSSHNLTLRPVVAGFLIGIVSQVKLKVLLAPGADDIDVLDGRPNDRRKMTMPGAQKPCFTLTAVEPLKERDSRPTQARLRAEPPSHQRHAASISIPAPHLQAGSRSSRQAHAFSGFLHRDRGVCARLPTYGLP
jgi:hypothetical protein